MSEEKFGNAFERLIEYLMLIHGQYSISWDTIKTKMIEYYSSGERYFGYNLTYSEFDSVSRTRVWVTEYYLIALPVNPSDDLTLAYLEDSEEIPRYTFKFPNHPQAFVTYTIFTNPPADHAKLLDFLLKNNLQVKITKNLPPFADWLGAGKEFRIMSLKPTNR